EATRRVQRAAPSSWGLRISGTFRRTSVPGYVYGSELPGPVSGSLFDWQGPRILAGHGATSSWCCLIAAGCKAAIYSAYICDNSGIRLINLQHRGQAGPIINKLNLYCTNHKLL